MGSPRYKHPPASGTAPGSVGGCSLWFLILWGCFLCGLQAQENPVLQGQYDARGGIRITSTGVMGQMHLLQRSEDLRQWTEVARTSLGFDAFPVVDRASATGFFRIHSRAAEASDDWKNQIRLPDDSFLSGTGDVAHGGFRWVKFTLRLDTPGLVYFQDSTRQPFHHGFITQRMAGFEGLSPQAIDALSLRAMGQRLVLGAVLVPISGTFREVGLQIIGQEPFPVDQVVSWLGQVREALVLPADWKVQYVPTLEQGTLPEMDQRRLEAAGFPVASVSRWIQQDEVYSPGWAHGRLRYVPAAEIQSEFVGGRLRPEDILLTDSIPAEIPILAGTISLGPATPNSHVAILSRSYGIPFVHVADVSRQAELRSWDGQEVLLMAGTDSGVEPVRIVNVDGFLTSGQRALLDKARVRPPLQITPMARRGTLKVPTRDLLPEDIRYVGGKAANFGSLVRSVPDHVPSPSLAFTFDLWMEFMDQPLPGGRTLRETVRERLKDHVFPPNMARLSADLAEIRALIRNVADFSASQKQAILEALATVDSGGNLRFRSSTNVEDSEQFSGAGLYDSYSGCLRDETDGDTEGPSQCDPTEPEERGVFRALRRVYASFFNDNAFLERLRHGVDEDTVGMAVLVHRSFPDEIEMANGVATIRVTSSGSPGTLAYSGELVLQPGSESVANPAGNALPEVVEISKTPGARPMFRLSRRASRLPLGATVLDWTSGYESLVELLELTALEFARVRPGLEACQLDLEFKRVAPGVFVVKQVREIPSKSFGNRPPPFTLGEAGVFEVFQHHGKDLYANHRLKSVWRFPSLVFEGEPGTAGWDVLVDLTRQDGTAIRRMSGRVGSFPKATITASGKTVVYRWNWPEGELRGAYQVIASFSQAPDPTKPLVWTDALQLDLSAQYDIPQVVIDNEGNRKTVTTETTRLVPLSRITEGSLIRQRRIQKGSILVETGYTLAFLKFGYPGIGIYDTKSFPLVQWKRTTLTGLTREPIQLTGTFSQTYDSIRHNFSESFLFEPALEPGIPAGVLAELREANVRSIRVEYGFLNTIELWIQGWDGTVRRAD